MTELDRVLDHIKPLLQEEQGQQDRSSKDRVVQLQAMLNKRGLKGIVSIKSVGGGSDVE